MDAQPKPPPIVVKPLPRVCKKRRSRHPIKILMLIVALAWPFLVIAAATALTMMAKQGARLQNDGNYYVHTEGVGWSQTSLLELGIGSLACAGTAVTMLWGGVMAILWVAWWATKN